MGAYVKYYLPGRKKGKWKYLPLDGNSIDREKFEEWKTKFYRLEGWDPASGWPQRNTLTSLDLSFVADELEDNHKIGRS